MVFTSFILAATKAGPWQSYPCLKRSNHPLATQPTSPGATDVKLQSSLSLSLQLLPSLLLAQRLWARNLTASPHGKRRGGVTPCSMQQFPSHCQTTHTGSCLIPNPAAKPCGNAISHPFPWVALLHSSPELSSRADMEHLELPVLSCTGPATSTLLLSQPCAHFQEGRKHAEGTPTFFHMLLGPVSWTLGGVWTKVVYSHPRSRHTSPLRCCMANQKHGLTWLKNNPGPGAGQFCAPAQHSVTQTSCTSTAEGTAASSQGLSPLQ